MLPVPYIVRRMWTVLLIFQSLLICIRGDCGPPPPMPHTLPVEETSGTPGSTFVYKCDREAGYYDLPGQSRTITCLDDNTWSTISDFCTRACGLPDRISFATPKEGELDKDFFLPGTTVSYNCIPGYKRAPGSNSITCRDDYTWSEPSEFCVRKSCVYPGDTRNGEFTATDGFFFGSTVTYTCDPGYRLGSRRNQRICQADGSWTNEVPVCEVVICPAPDAPANGSYNPVKDEYSYLDAVTFTCNKDLHVIGENTASCTRDGTWSHVSPTCKAVQCPDPGEVKNGKRISGFVGPYSLNFAVRFECDDKYILEGSSSITCTSNNVWEPEIPKCLLVQCPEPGEVQNGKKKPGSVGPYLVNSKVEFECNEGYVLKGSRSITCISNNKWDSDIPTCTLVQCPDPGQVQHGTRISGIVGPYTLNYKVEFRCDENYVLEGSSSITCTSSNKWDSDIPTCRLLGQCPEPGEVKNGKKKSGSVGPYLLNHKVEFVCDDNYILEGSSSITCTSSYTWDSDLPKCHPRYTDRLSTGAIVGIVIACLVVVFGSCCLCWCCSKKKSGKAKCDTTDVQYTACNDTPLRAKEDAMA
ncbi:complement component receptor 1-like protein isoform 2-T2 [Leptodactylus fuscus]|uniref:complement component receptor 1-like protein isoform X2 n=1 Tax=Leptodactylus fuscus TaxID=238119 RepID=UPI003F4E5595